MKELARPGELTQNATFRFEFPKVEKPYESYVGSNVKLRYVLFLRQRLHCCGTKKMHLEMFGFFFKYFFGREHICQQKFNIVLA